MMTAANIVQGLAIVLVVATANSQSLPVRTKWALILLALIAGLLATVHRQGAA